MTKEKVVISVFITLLALWGLSIWASASLGSAYDPDNAPVWAFLIIISSMVIVIIGSVVIFAVIMYGVVMAMEPICNKIKRWFNNLPER